jgi:hypothetical protein
MSYPLFVPTEMTPQSNTIIFNQIGADEARRLLRGELSHDEKMTQIFDGIRMACAYTGHTRKPSTDVDFAYGTDLTREIHLLEKMGYTASIAQASWMGCNLTIDWSRPLAPGTLTKSAAKGANTDAVIDMSCMSIE